MRLLLTSATVSLVASDTVATTFLHFVPCTAFQQRYARFRARVHPRIGHAKLRKSWNKGGELSVGQGLRGAAEMLRRWSTISALRYQLPAHQIFGGPSGRNVVESHRRVEVTRPSDLTVGGEMAKFRQLGMSVSPKLSDNRFLPAVYGPANVANDVFSIFILNQVLVLDQIGDRLLDCSP